MYAVQNSEVVTSKLSEKEQTTKFADKKRIIHATENQIITDSVINYTAIAETNVIINNVHLNI